MHDVIDLIKPECSVIFESQGQKLHSKVAQKTIIARSDSIEQTINLHRDLVSCKQKTAKVYEILPSDSEHSNTLSLTKIYLLEH